jgi:hypothetical protein
MKESFAASKQGRLQSAAFAVAMVGAAVWRSSDHTAGFGALIIAFAMVLTLFALGTGLKDHFATVILLSITLPYLAFLGFIGMLLMPHDGIYALVLAAIGFVGWAVHPATPATPVPELEVAHEAA